MEFKTLGIYTGLAALAMGAKGLVGKALAGSTTTVNPIMNVAEKLGIGLSDVISSFGLAAVLRDNYRAGRATGKIGPGSGTVTGAGITLVDNVWNFATTSVDAAVPYGLTELGNASLSDAYWVGAALLTGAGLGALRRYHVNKPQANQLAQTP